MCPIEAESLAQVLRNLHLDRLDESTLSRVWQHTTNPETAFAMLSASRGERTAEQNVQANISLAADIRAAGYGYFWLSGYYIENKGTEYERHVVEDSLFVIGNGVKNNAKMSKTLSDLAAKYNQEEIFFKPAGEQYGYLVKDGQKNSSPMKIHPDRMAQIYSKLKTGSHADRDFYFETAGTASSAMAKWSKKKLLDSVDNLGMPSENIQEMANLGPRLTGGLPKVLHIWHQGEDSRSQHGPRVKASFYAHRFDEKENVSISVSDDPQIVAPAGFNFGPNFTRKDFLEIREWILKRKEKLLKYWIDSSVTVDEITAD